MTEPSKEWQAIQPFFSTNCWPKETSSSCVVITSTGIGVAVGTKTFAISPKGVGVGRGVETTVCFLATVTSSGLFIRSVEQAKNKQVIKNIV